MQHTLGMIVPIIATFGPTTLVELLLVQCTEAFFAAANITIIACIAICVVSIIIATMVAVASVVIVVIDDEGGGSVAAVTARAECDSHTSETPFQLAAASSTSSAVCPS